MHDARSRTGTILSTSLWSASPFPHPVVSTQPPASTGVPLLPRCHPTTTMPRRAIAFPEKLEHLTHRSRGPCCYLNAYVCRLSALRASCCYLIRRIQMPTLPIRQTIIFVSDMPIVRHIRHQDGDCGRCDAHLPDGKPDHALSARRSPAACGGRSTPAGRPSQLLISSDQFLSFLSVLTTFPPRFSGFRGQNR